MAQFVARIRQGTTRLVFLLVMLAVACGPPAREPSTPATSTAGTTQAPTLPASESGTQPGAVITRAIAALSQSLKVDQDDVIFVAMERQDFPDAALGCSQPGEAAAAVITPGYKVIMRASNVEYELHMNLDGTLVRCLPTEEPVVGLPDFGTGTPDVGTPEATDESSPEDEPDNATIDEIAAALSSKDYERLGTALSDEFWLGFFASEANSLPRDEAIETLKETYLGPGLVRVYADVSVEKLLPEWTSAAPYARFVYSSGWGESQKDDAILLFEERADNLFLAGLFYVFESLKTAAYGEQATHLPLPPVERLGAIIDAIESKAYNSLLSLVTTPAFLGFYNSEVSPLSPEAFIQALRNDYLDAGEVKIRPDVDVSRLLPEWTIDPPCDELLYSTGWGKDQTDDGILCLRQDGAALRWGGILYIFASLKETAYAEQPPAETPDEPDGMVLVEAGSFLMGSGAGDVGAVQAACQATSSGCDAGQFEDETPQRQITLKAFYMDKTEVTLAQYKEFVNVAGYRTTSEAKGDPIQYTWRVFDTPERQEHPVRWMSWHDADAYCQWAGKRLPTEAEWEKAARGTQGLLYPWGNVWDETRVPQDDTAAVTAFPSGASPYGVLGMAGGVWEWVFDGYDPLYYQRGPTVDPAGPGQTNDKVLRGGAFGNAMWQQRTTHRHFGGATGYAHDHGFRCALDVE